MAQIINEKVVIQFSKLVKNADKGEYILTEELLEKIETAIQECMPDGVIVEFTGE